jgi:hypothetical protein
VRTITQYQLAAALPRVILPGGMPLDACLVTTATPAELAAAIFKVAEELLPETEKWETGAVYADPGLPGQTYRRTDWGWRGLHSGEDFRDGQLVTAEFRKLGFPGGSR